MRWWWCTTILGGGADHWEPFFRWWWCIKNLGTFLLLCVLVVTRYWFLVVPFFCQTGIPMKTVGRRLIHAKKKDLCRLVLPQESPKDACPSLQGRQPSCPCHLSYQLSGAFGHSLMPILGCFLSVVCSEVRACCERFGTTSSCNSLSSPAWGLHASM